MKLSYNSAIPSINIQGNSKQEPKGEKKQKQNLYMDVHRNTIHNDL